MTIKSEPTLLQTVTLSSKLAAKVLVNSACRRMVTDCLVGLGMSGLIVGRRSANRCWCMTGLWWDNHHPGAHSWTLILLAIGCAWVAQMPGMGGSGEQAMQDGQETK